MNTQTTVLMIGALAKVMELSKTNCPMIAEQTVIALHALDCSQELPLSLKAQIEEMLDSLEEQYQLDQQDPSHKLKPASQDSEVFCIRSMLTRALPLYADASLE